MTTTYSYDSNTADLTGIVYTNDDGLTPDVAFTYTRDGRLYTVSDGAGTRTFNYDASTLELVNEDLPDGYFEANRDVVRVMPAAAPLGRLAGLKDRETGPDYSVTYGYDAANGRLTTASGPGLPAGGVVYNYLPQSHLLERIDYKDAANVIATSTREFERTATCSLRC